MKPVNLFFVCSGLGNVNRGYETFTQECFDALKGDPRLKVKLFKGGGIKRPDELPLPNIKRFGKTAKFFARFLKKEAYMIEQVTFFFSLVPFLWKEKPDVILISDFQLSTYLWHFRKFSNLKYKIIFSNGAPNGPPFHRCDHVQQLLPLYYNWAVKGGTAPEMQSVIPYGINIAETKLPAATEKQLLRKELGIPEEAYTIISVAAINNHHKRMSYLIDEFAGMDDPDAFLILLGQFEKETADILAHAQQQLRPGTYLMTSVKQDKVKDFYRAADVFTLGSLKEGFGMVLLEALSYGLPMLVHDAENFREVLGEFGHYGDLKQKGMLTNMLREEKLRLSQPGLPEKRRTFVKQNYGWEYLKEKYIDMILKVYSLI